MANSGVVVVTELRKFVNGVDTGQTKPNVAGDKNYIAPYLGTLTCLPNTDAVTTTTSTSTTSTTTSLNYKIFETSTASYPSTAATCNHPFTGTTNSLRHFSGASNLPAINDTVYSDANGQNLLGTGRYYSTLNSSEYTIATGKVTSIFACSAPTTTTTSTTTTTTAATTTTTTTVAPICYDYEIASEPSGNSGTMFYYTRCDGNVMSSYVPTGDSISICAQVNTVTRSNNHGTIVANAFCSS